MLAGRLRCQRDLAELLHLHAKPRRLARQERARAGRAQRVHGVVHGYAVLHADDLRVLPAYLQDGAHVRVQVRRAHGVRGDLVLHHGRAQHGPHEAPCAAGGAHGAHAHGRMVDLRAQVGHHPPRRIRRVALRPQVRPRHDGAVGVHDDALRGDGPDVYPGSIPLALARRRNARRCGALRRRTLPLQALLTCRNTLRLRFTAIFGDRRASPTSVVRQLFFLSVISSSPSSWPACRRTPRAGCPARCRWSASRSSGTGWAGPCRG